MSTRKHVSTTARYYGHIKCAGATFNFETTATSEAEAKNNGIAQYARQANMNIAQLRRYLKDYNATIEARLDRRGEQDARS